MRATTVTLAVLVSVSLTALAVLSIATVSPLATGLLFFGAIAVPAGVLVSDAFAPLAV